MGRELIILVIYVGDRLPWARVAELQANLKKSFFEMPDDVLKKYTIKIIMMVHDGPNKVECVFPKEPDPDVMAKLDEIITNQEKFMGKAKDE